MSKEHFKKLREIIRDEGLWQAAKYDFDKSATRLLIPYFPEMIPGILGLKNYQTLLRESVHIEDDRTLKIMNKGIIGAISLGSEIGRYIITSVVYNETKSPQAALLAYTLTSSFFSTKNQVRENRFYKPKTEVKPK